MTLVFNDLFEDEISSLLDEYSESDIEILCDTRRFEKALTVCEDGLYYSGKGYFVEYIAGFRMGLYGSRYLMNTLAHKKFFLIVKGDENK